MFYKGTTSKLESIVCAKVEFGEWHRKECLYGNYAAWGVEKLSLCSKELNGINDKPM